MVCFSDPGVLCLCQFIYIKLWQANLLAPKKGQISGPSKFQTEHCGGVVITVIPPQGRKHQKCRLVHKFSGFPNRVRHGEWDGGDKTFRISYVLVYILINIRTGEIDTNKNPVKCYFAYIRMANMKISYIPSDDRR